MNARLFLILYITACVNCFVIFDQTSDRPSKCCIRDEWQGFIYLDYGTVFIDQDTLDVYYNGTMHVAYSIPEKKFYYRLHIVEQSPLIPQPIAANQTVLKDYAMGISYTVSNGACQKDTIEKSMQKQCIPADAKLLSRGEFGDVKNSIETYSFMTGDPDLQFKVTATVMTNDFVSPRNCEPFHATYFTPSVNPDSGTMYTLNVMDISQLKTKDVFKVPEECKSLH